MSSESPDGISCGKCKWWCVGDCRLHPPQMVLWPTDNQHPIMYIYRHQCGPLQERQNGAAIFRESNDARIGQ